jgi:hypothetical protein
LGEDGLDRLGEPLKAVDAGDQHIADAALVQIVEHREPELGAFCVLPPDPERVAVAVAGDAEREVAGAASHRTVLCDLDAQRVEVDDRIDLV